MICKCGNIIPQGRIDIGYTTCLPCGEKAAKKEIIRRKSCITIPYNKGPYMYAGSKEQIDKK